MKDGKHELRKHISEMRNKLSHEQLVSASRRIQDLLFEVPEFQSSSMIMFYVSFRSEVQTHRMIEEALAIGKKIVVPAVSSVREELDLLALCDLDDLKPGAYGILEPTARADQVPPENLDLVIVPGLVFDPRGFRLGYGKGYYDKLLKRLRPDVPTIALAYDFQVVERIQAIEYHDVAVNSIVTEKRVILCRQGRPD